MASSGVHLTKKARRSDVEVLPTADTLFIYLFWLLTFYFSFFFFFLLVVNFVIH